jgi:hypothetical protein
MQEELNGKTIDRYEVRSLIEKGPLGDVYLGFDPKLDREDGNTRGLPGYMILEKPMRGFSW